MNRSVILELYHKQPHGTDTLGGTLELAQMCVSYRAQTHEVVTESEMLTELIRLRKSGVLKARRDKQEPQKPTWPKINDDGLFKVPVTINIGYHTMYQIIASYLRFNDKLPVTRQEVFDYFQEFPYSLVSEYGCTPAIEQRLLQLFPELKRS